MKITWALVAYLIWFGVMLFALTGAIMACARRRLMGLPCGAALLSGGLLMFGFVSGIVGLYEIPDYARTFQFWAAMTAGLAGLVLFYLGIRRR